jgi:hypothetical protein
MPQKPFDHDQHVKLLQLASHELRQLGKSDLATACDQAVMLHREFESRVATSRREVDRIRKARDLLESIARTTDEYVGQTAGPWIGCELFPKDKAYG